MKGFVTIACGKDEYYQMACNLLKSYKLHNPDGVPFAILCDRENEYTKQFMEGTLEGPMQIASS